MSTYDPSKDPECEQPNYKGKACVCCILWEERVEHILEREYHSEEKHGKAVAYYEKKIRALQKAMREGAQVNA